MLCQSIKRRIFASYKWLCVWCIFFLASSISVRARRQGTDANVIFCSDVNPTVTRKTENMCALNANRMKSFLSRIIAAETGPELIALYCAEIKQYLFIYLYAYFCWKKSSIFFFSSFSVMLQYIEKSEKEHQTRTHNSHCIMSWKIYMMITLVSMTAFDHYLLTQWTLWRRWICDKRNQNKTHKRRKMCEPQRIRCAHF